MSYTQAEKWFAAGVKEAQEFRNAWAQARQRAICAGFNFIRAHQACGHGEWLQFLERHAAQIKPRTVQFYMQLSAAALEWAQAESPQLEGVKLESFAASQVMLMSPKPLVALLRDLRAMRPFGEYDAVRYAAQKRIVAGARQVEFDFVSVSTQIDLLAHLAEPNYSLKVPEGKTEVEALRELETKLDAALKTIRSELEAKTVVEV